MKIEAGQTNLNPVKNRASARSNWLMICACVIMLIQTGTTTADSPAEPASYKSSNRERQLERQLWQDNISPPAENAANRKTDELKRMIEQIRSIQFESSSANQAEPQAAEHVEPQQQAAPKNEKQKAESQPLPDVIAASEVSNDKSMSSRTLHKVEQLLKDPNSITNPLELAEVLFQTGEPALAGVCYKKALASINVDDPNVATERAWILFQIGNCLKDPDPGASKETYAELIRTAPDSPWAQIAKSRYGLIDWYQQEQPRKLIEELNR